MASCATGSIGVSRASSSSNAIVQTIGNSWSNSSPYFYDVRCYSYWGIGSITDGQTDQDSYSSSGSWNGVIGSLSADTTYKFQARTYHTYTSGSPEWANGTIKSKKTGAVLATASTPTSESVTASSATIKCNYYPNVNASTCSAQLQYKKASDGSWTNAGTPNATGGYSQVEESEDISGLDAGTQYQVRLVITRDTTVTADNTVTSDTYSFTTLAGNPSVTTDAATGVNAGVSGVSDDGGATLNGTLDINEGEGVNVYFKWGTDTPPTENTTANQSKSADGSFSQAISGLTESETYYFQAYASYTYPGSGSPVSGDILSFVVPADPGAVAALEDHVLTYEYDRKYGVETAVVFAVADDSAGSSDRFFNDAVPWAEGDVKISLAGAAVANVTNLPTRIGSTPLYTITLTAAEMAADDIYVYLVDADGPAWRDTLLHVRTHLRLGSVDIDAATGTKANTSAMTLKGYGTGHGLYCVGGATGKDISGLLGSMIAAKGNVTSSDSDEVTLTDGFVATNDYYNGAVILFNAGTGAGQARVITDFVGGTGVATLNKALATALDSTTDYIIFAGDDTWNVGPTAELAALPTYSSSYANMLQFLFQRFVYKRTQTATEFTMYNEAGDTALASGGVDDDGSVQTHEVLS